MVKRKIDIFRILQLAAFSVFAGRAWQHLFWDAPYRELFWDPFYMKWFIEGFTSMSWGDYVTHPEGDIWFQRLVLAQGVFYLVCAISTLFVKKLPKWGRAILLVGAANLVFLALLYLKDKFYHVGQFFEYSLQFGAPIFLFYFLKHGVTARLGHWIKVAIALTFICHGLYAVAYYPRPQSFMTMTQNILSLDGVGTAYFLRAAGILDFIVAVGIFLPIKWARPFLIYAVVWGFLTSMARIFGNFYWDFPMESLNQWVFEAVFRFPHFLLPLVLLLAPQNNSRKSEVY